MNEVQGSELLLLGVLLLHIIVAPGTKVEESFNVQAIHDVLYHGVNISAYDHNEFPGVVPRTFVGAVVIAILNLPLRLVQLYFGFSKIWILFSVRFTLGASCLLSFCRFCRVAQRHFGAETAYYLRLLTASQFHFIFYFSRPLPNTLVLPLVLLVFSLWLDDRLESAARVAIVATLLFRCELVLLFAPLFLPSLIRGRIPFLPVFSSFSALGIAISTTVAALACSLPLDSLLWGRLLWPEAEVAWFNVLQNRSHEYGTSPILWYFYSALPRALTCSLPVLPLGLFLERRLCRICLPPLVFISLYSLLPHKELRFILYVVPLLNLPAACLCARLHIGSVKGGVRWLLSFLPWLILSANLVATSFFVAAASTNYPAADAMAWLQHSQRLDGAKQRSVFIDVFSAQNGISRFYHLYDTWEYNKTESISPEDYTRFDFAIVGGSNLKEYVAANFSSFFRPMVVIPAFAGVSWKRQNVPVPFYLPEIKMKERVAVLKKKDS